MNERWKLIQAGHDHRSIKISNGSIFLNLVTLMVLASGRCSALLWILPHPQTTLGSKYVPADMDSHSSNTDMVSHGPNADPILQSAQTN